MQTTQPTRTTFRIHPIPGQIAELARTTGVDASGNPVEHVTAPGGQPLRCCLRDARPGEKLLLINYRPVLPAGPYIETGAIWVHAEPCDGSSTLDEYPTDWIDRPQILRAYDARGWIHPASTMHDGTDPVAAITAVLADQEVVQIHSRNIVYGCYMMTITR